MTDDIEKSRWNGMSKKSPENYNKRDNETSNNSCKQSDK